MILCIHRDEGATSPMQRYANANALNSLKRVLCLAVFA